MNTSSYTHNILGVVHFLQRGFPSRFWERAVCGFASCLWSPVCSSPPRSVGLPLFLPCCPEGCRGGVPSSALILPICLQHRVTLTTQLQESLPLMPFSETQSLHHFWPLVNSLMSLSGLSSPRQGLCRQALERASRLLHHPLPFPLWAWIWSPWTILSETRPWVRPCSRCSSCVKSCNPPRCLMRENTYYYYFSWETLKHWEFIFLEISGYDPDCSWSWSVISVPQLLGSLLVTYTHSQAHLPFSLSLSLFILRVPCFWRFIAVGFSHHFLPHFWWLPPFPSSSALFISRPNISPSLPIL